MLKWRHAGLIDRPGFRTVGHLVEIMSEPITPDSELGLGLPPGTRHHRAYIGRPEDYDLIAAMVFSLLTCAGLRQHHRVLDIGCGSLRIGRLLIAYLNRCCYVGIEPNEWLVRAGIERELGHEQTRIKQPRFSFADSCAELDASERYDFAIAQSIFTHCGRDLIERWLDDTARHLGDDGVLFATYYPGDRDWRGSGWVYPYCVQYREESLSSWAAAAGLHAMRIDWQHPRRQRWLLFTKSEDAWAWLGQQAPSWNRYVDRLGGSVDP